MMVRIASYYYYINIRDAFPENVMFSEAWLSSVFAMVSTSMSTVELLPESPS